MDAKIEGRIARLLNAHTDLCNRYTKTPNGQKKMAMGKRILEYEISMKNLKEHGVEKIVGGKKGVDIKVPLRKFEVKDVMGGG